MKASRSRPLSRNRSGRPEQGTKRARQYEHITESAKQLGINGRSKMNKAQLQRAITAKR
jgi:hypothetical protein